MAFSLVITPAHLALVSGVITALHMGVWSPFVWYTDLAISLLLSVGSFVWLVARWHSPMGNKLRSRFYFSGIVTVVLLSCFMSLGMGDLWMHSILATTVFVVSVAAFWKGKLQFVNLHQLLKVPEDEEEEDIPEEEESAESESEDEVETTQNQQQATTTQQQAPQHIVDGKNINFSSMVKRYTSLHSFISQHVHTIVITLAFLVTRYHWPNYFNRWEKKVEKEEVEQQKVQAQEADLIKHKVKKWQKPADAANPSTHDDIIINNHHHAIKHA